MTMTSQHATDFDVPNGKQVLAAGAWLLLAIGSFTSDAARETHREYRLHPNDPRSVAPRRIMTWDESQASATGALADAASTPGGTPQAISRADQERERRRKEL